MVDLLGILKGTSNTAPNTASNYTLSNQNVVQNQFNSNGFVVQPIAASDGFGLPSSQTPYNRPAVRVRNIMKWFVPEVGVISMYINPQNINYRFTKIIQQERTKGGYNVQYWGEELPTLSINGSTGSSGVEGINVLEQIYRSEQYTFDAAGLIMSSNNFISGLSDLVNSTANSVFGNNLLGNIVGSATNGVFGLDPASQSMLPKNIPSLASLAISIELYWSGWVFRGFFKSFNFDESADRVGMFNYQMEFVVTQRRGYRYNSMPWQHSAISGPSDHNTIPYTFENTDARSQPIVTSSAQKLR